MSAVRFIMVGGFLGAGKTTMLGRLARHYQAEGKRVGVITNDQAENLVDTQSLREQGLAAEEIPGGCFCCRFNALADAAGKLAREQRPDVLLAEPVGSCTDLIATVVQPLKRLYADRYQIAPYVVLVDPVRVKKVLLGERHGGFSPKVAYLFHKQLEEADAIAINKAETLNNDARGELHELLARRFPHTSIFLVSGRTGQGMDPLVDLLGQNGAFGRNIPEVDYDVYAEGEAELGWLNAAIRIHAESPFPPDELLLELLRDVQSRVRRSGKEIAHVKLLLSANGQTAVANLTTSGGVPELSRRFGVEDRETISGGDAELIVNARVHADPDDLWRAVQSSLDQVCCHRGMSTTIAARQHFRPGRPVPTHRFAEAV